MSGFAIFDTDTLRQLHCRAAWLHSNDVSDNLGEADIQLVRSYGILTDEWAAKDEERRPRYVMDAASHVVLLLCCGGLANALADTGEEFEAEALVWLRWCIALGDAVGDTAEAAKEHTHFNSMFRCNTPSAPFIAPTTPAMQRAVERLRKVAPAASFNGRHHKSRTVKTFVLKHRIDPTFLDQLPRKLVAVGASGVAASFNSETETKCWTLADVAVALSGSEMHTPIDQDDDHLPIALMQAVLDTSDDVWIFQNPSGEFADIIVVWSTAVWLTKVKHHKQSTDYQEWELCYEEHKMGSGTVEALSRRIARPASPLQTSIS